MICLWQGWLHLNTGIIRSLLAILYGKFPTQQKTVLGYDFAMATWQTIIGGIGRHGSLLIFLCRKARKLTGLQAGLILEASGIHRATFFRGYRIERLLIKRWCPIYPFRQYDKMSREEMLRQLANYRDHHNAIDGAATSGFTLHRPYNAQAKK